LPSSAAPGMPSDGTSGYAARISSAKKSGNAAMVAGLTTPIRYVWDCAVVFDADGDEGGAFVGFGAVDDGHVDEVAEASCREVNFWIKLLSITSSKGVMAVNAV
jgi:hypothetical protein